MTTHCYINRQSSELYLSLGDFGVPEVIYITCNMGTSDLPNKYALEHWACISGKSLMPML